jgi:hypothetical protein
MVEVVVGVDKVGPETPEHDQLPDGDEKQRQKMKGIEPGKAKYEKLLRRSLALRYSFGIKPKENKSRQAKEEIHRPPAIRVKRLE